jgi:hypothetical protein
MRVPFNVPSRYTLQGAGLAAPSAQTTEVNPTQVPSVQVLARVRPDARSPASETISEV